MTRTLIQGFRFACLRHWIDPSLIPNGIIPLIHRKCLESQSLVEGIGSSLVLGAQTRDNGLCAGASGLSSSVGTADVGELVADELHTPMVSTRFARSKSLPEQHKVLCLVAPRDSRGLHLRW